MQIHNHINPSGILDDDILSAIYFIDHAISSSELVDLYRSDILIEISSIDVIGEYIELAKTTRSKYKPLVLSNLLNPNMVNQQRIHTYICEYYDGIIMLFNNILTSNLHEPEPTISVDTLQAMQSFFDDMDNAKIEESSPLSNGTMESTVSNKEYVDGIECATNSILALQPISPSTITLLRNSGATADDVGRSISGLLDSRINEGDVNKIIDIMCFCFIEHGKFQQLSGTHEYVVEYTSEILLILANIYKLLIKSPPSLGYCVSCICEQFINDKNTFKYHDDVECIGLDANSIALGVVEQLGESHDNVELIIEANIYIRMREPYVLDLNEHAFMRIIHEVNMILRTPCL